MTQFGKFLPGLQVFLAIVSVILVLTTPFAWFKFYGYGAFALKNTDTDLLAGLVVLTTLGIAYSGYMMGWGASGQGATRYAKWTLYLGAFQWVLVFFIVIAVYSDIIYNASFSTEGYYWWLDAASYAVVLGAILFTILGVIALFRSRVPSPFPSAQTPFPAAPSPAYTSQPSSPSAPSGVQSSPSQGTGPTNINRFCTNCGAPIPMGAVFCTNCGKSAAH